MINDKRTIVNFIADMNRRMGQLEGEEKAYERILAVYARYEGLPMHPQRSWHLAQEVLATIKQRVAEIRELDPPEAKSHFSQVEAQNLKGNSKALFDGEWGTVVEVKAVFEEYGPSCSVQFIPEGQRRSLWWNGHPYDLILVEDA